MFDNFTYKQKLFGLGLLFVLLLLTANKRSFKSTINAYDQMMEVSERLDYMKSSSFSKQELINQINHYNKLIGSTNGEIENVQQSILDFATKYPSVNIEQLYQSHEATHNQFTVVTNQLILEGEFSSLRYVIYEFEKKFKFSNLTSVSFFKEKKSGKNKNGLKVKLIFQNYEKNS